MVSIKASYTVIPSEPTPIGTMCLSQSDQLVRWTHATTIYIYKENPKHDAIERMKDSLSKILVHYYPVAGRLRWIEGGRLELDCNAKGVVLVEAKSSKTMAEYGDFSPKGPVMDLVPSFDYTLPTEEIPLMVIQLTRFHGRGAALGVSLSHSLVDGSAYVRFINTWAKVVRGHTLDFDEMFPTLDRSLLKSSHPSLAPRFDHPEFKPLPLILGCSDYVEEQKKKLITVTLTLRSEQVEKLKRKANDQFQTKKGSRPYSKYEAMAAYIWRCACKARLHDHLQPTQAIISVDIRNRLNPPLPRNYFGNAVSRVMSPACYAGEIISNPLSYAAQKIREGVDLVTDEYIRSQQDFIKGQVQLDGIKTSLNFDGENRNSKGQFFGNPNIFILSWMSLPWQEANFGWGKPIYYGPAVSRPSDTAILIRSLDQDDSIIISMYLQEAHMQLFTKFFWQDMSDSRI